MRVSIFAVCCGKKQKSLIKGTDLSRKDADTTLDDDEVLASQKAMNCCGLKLRRH